MPPPSSSAKPLNQRPPWRSLGVVFAGGLLGSALRLGLGEIVAGSGRFPITAVMVNLIGSLVLGWFLARRERAIDRSGSTRFWAIGVLGSFTTFSAFSADLVELVADDHLMLAGAYLGLSVPGGLALALIGRRMGQRIGVVTG